jgi:hypothetical protein
MEDEKLPRTHFFKFAAPFPASALADNFSHRKIFLSKSPNWLFGLQF